MNEVNVKLTSREQRLINELAERFQSNTRMPEFIRVDEIKKDSDESDDDIQNLIDKFVRLQLVEWHSNNKLKILPQVLSASHQIENPPAKNYFNEITKWWFSAVWRSVITVIFLLLPLIVKWIEMIQTCLKWLIGSES